MMIVTTRLTRKKAVLGVLGLGALMALAIILAAAHDAPEEGLPPLDSNEARVEYLSSLGWELNPEPLETLQFLLPEKLEEPFLSYNELQDSQGFDLSTCCGKQVARYTYAVSNYPGRSDGVQLNLYICEEKAVAGDVFCPGADGFQGPIVYPRS